MTPPSIFGAHVRRLKLPGPADAAALLGLASAGMSAPLPRDQSPWSFDLVDLAPAGSALLVRIHHCIADGRALVALLEQLADEAPARREGTTHPRHRRPGCIGGAHGSAS